MERMVHESSDHTASAIIVYRRNVMKSRILVSGLLFAIMSVSAIGAGFIGTPTAELKKGQWSVGYNFMISDLELDKTTITRMGEEILNYPDWVNLRLEQDRESRARNFPADQDLGDPVFLQEQAALDQEFLASDTLDLGVFGTEGRRESLSFQKMSINSVEIKRHYATFGYGVTDWCEIYFQLGSADFQARFKEDGGTFMGYSGGNDFARGLGAKFTVLEKDNIRWGTSIQMNWLDTDSVEDGTWRDDELHMSGQWKRTMDIETFDLLLAVGPTVDFGAVKLYGGPFYYYFSGEIESRYRAYNYGDVIYNSYMTEKADLETSSNFGAFVGAQLVLTETTSVTTEFAYTGGAWAVGAGVTWKF